MPRYKSRQEAPRLFKVCPVKACGKRCQPISEKCIRDATNAGARLVVPTPKPKVVKLCRAIPPPGQALASKQGSVAPPSTSAMVKVKGKACPAPKPEGGRHPAKAARPPHPNELWGSCCIGRPSPFKDPASEHETNLAVRTGLLKPSAHNTHWANQALPGCQCNDTRHTEHNPAYINQ